MTWQSCPSRDIQPLLHALDGNIESVLNARGRRLETFRHDDVANFVSDPLLIAVNECMDLVKFIGECDARICEVLQGKNGTIVQRMILGEVCGNGGTS